MSGTIKFLHTGDLESVNQDGFLSFFGRIKKIYLTKGSDNSVYKLFPVQIENELEKIEDVLECGTIVMPDHAVPKKIMLIEKMPYTQSNKIDYKKLEEKYQKEL